MNTVAVTGNLTRNPELRSVSDTARIAEFGLALNRKRKSPSGEMIEETTFVEIKCWQGTADIVMKFCNKGDRIGVTGRIQQDRWVDKETQKNREKTYITAEQVEFLGAGQKAERNDDGDDGDIPL